MHKFLILVMALLVTACGTSVPSVKPYKLEIQQGNVVTSKMLLQLKPGMTRSQVRYIMGTPLIQDSFHGNRWDYFYQMREQGKITAQRRIYLTFNNELLEKIYGDVVAQGSSDAVAADPDAPKGVRVVQPQIKKKEKGFFDSLMFWKDDDDQLSDIEVPKPAEQPIDLTEAEQAEEKQKKGFFSRLKFWGDDDEEGAETSSESVDGFSNGEMREIPADTR